MKQTKYPQHNKQKLKKTNKSQKRQVNSGKQLSPFAIYENQYIQGTEKSYEYEEFLVWITKPKWERGAIKTQKDFAKHYNISEKTISIWKKNINFDNEYKQAMRERLNLKLSDVLDSLYKEAVNGSHKHAKLFLEYINQINS